MESGARLFPDQSTAKTIVVHIGPHKTGTSAIQVALTENRSVLGRAGFTYPDIGFRSIGHHDLAERLLLGPPSALDEIATALNRFDENIILSSEDLSKVRPPQLNSFFSRLKTRNVRVIFYLRSFLPLLFSFWQEEVKHGMPAPFLEFCSNFLLQPFAMHWMNPQRLLEDYASVFGRDAITIYRYDQIVRTRGDVAVHFMNEVLGITDYSRPKNGERRNVGLAVVPAELMRRLNAVGLNGHGAMGEPMFIHLLMEMVQKSQPFVGTLNLSYDMFLFAHLERELIKQWGDRIVGLDRGAPHLFEERTHVARFLRTDIWTEVPSLNQTFQLLVDRRKRADAANVSKSRRAS